MTLRVTGKRASASWLKHLYTQQEKQKVEKKPSVSESPPVGKNKMHPYTKATHRIKAGVSEELRELFSTPPKCGTFCEAQPIEDYPQWQWQVTTENGEMFPLSDALLQKFFEKI